MFIYIIYIVDGDEEQLQRLQTEGITVFEKGPRLVDIVDLDERNNIIRSERINPATFKPELRTFSEKEGIQDLVGFIDTTIRTAVQAGDVKIQEGAELFNKNLVFVGERELRKATQGIAQHLLEEAQKGKDIIIFPANIRSERYISLRVLEEIDYLTEQTPELRRRIKITQSIVEAVGRYRETLGNCRIIVPDDFVVSGTRIQGFADRIYNGLLNQGLTPDKASEVIEADVVAMPQGKDRERLKIGRERGNERELRVFSYYGISEYTNSEGKWVVFTGVSLTGAHSSTDYGFETELENFQRYLKEKGVDRDLPLLHRVVRPYDMADGSSSRYKDEELQKRWDRVQEKYGIKSVANHTPGVW